MLTDNEHHAIPPDSFWEDGWLNKQPLHQDSKSSPSSHTPHVHLSSFGASKTRVQGLSFWEVLVDPPSPRFDLAASAWKAERSGSVSFLGFIFHRPRFLVEIWYDMYCSCFQGGVVTVNYTMRVFVCVCTRISECCSPNLHKRERGCSWLEVAWSRKTAFADIQHELNDQTHLGPINNLADFHQGAIPLLNFTHQHSLCDVNPCFKHSMRLLSGGARQYFDTGL